MFSFTGLSGEMEVMEILRKHEESGSMTLRTGSGGGSMEELKDSILKVIRRHIEQVYIHHSSFRQEGSICMPNLRGPWENGYTCPYPFFDI